MRVAGAAQSRRGALHPAAKGSRTPPGRPTVLDVAGQRPRRSGARSKLEKVEEPLDYRVAAGPASSPTYRIGVRYPLAIKSFDVGDQAARLHEYRAEHGEGGRPSGHRGDRRNVPDHVRFPTGRGVPGHDGSVRPLAEGQGGSRAAGHPAQVRRHARTPPGSI